MSEDNPKAVEPPKGVTLGEFLDENQRSLAVLGVFAALGIIWKSVSVGEKNPLLAYLCFFITVPIFWEVVSKGFSRAAHWRLTWFLIVLNIIFYQATISIVFGWPEHLGQTIMIVIWVALFSAGGKWASDWETSRIDQRYNDYIQKFNSVPGDDPLRAEKQRKINLDYLEKPFRIWIIDIAPTIGLILLILLLVVVLRADFYQALIDGAFRPIAPVEVPLNTEP